jgi:pyruvate dehydrogenase E2 component (dihydrolipoamide acetyltransferase)
MENGTIARWLKREGDDVKKGDQLADVETDKATMPFESYAEGTLSKILVPEGQSVPIGTPIAVISAANVAAAPAPAASAAPAPQPFAPPVPTAAANATSNAAALSESARPASAATGSAATNAVTSAETIVRASPIARRLAEEMGVDLRDVTGTGPGGRITREDVEAVAQTARPSPISAPAPAPVPPPAPPSPAPPPAPVAVAPSAERPLTRIQQTIARRMVQSKTTVPHFYVTVEADMTEAVRLRDQLNQAWTDGRIGFTEMIVKAAAVALQAYPIVNASWKDDRIVYHEDVNIGLAVSVDGGLLVPVLHQVNRTDLRTLSRKSKELIQRTRDGKSLPGDFEGGTFTVSSLGQYPVDNFLAIVNPPESAILAVSRIEKRPVVRNDALAISETVHLSLSGDHRVFYGTHAAEYLTRLKEILEHPLAMLT